MTYWEKLLKSLGFTDSESKMYLVSLEMGEASVQDLAKKAKVSRVTAYTVIEALMKSGLMSTVNRGKKKLFLAESPERLVSFVHARVKNMESTLREVESSIEELKLLQRGEKPIVKMFVGKEGIKAFQEDMLTVKPKETFEFCGNLERMIDLYPTEENREFFNAVDRMRPKRKIIFYTNDPTPARKGFPDEEVLILNEPHVLMYAYGDVIVYENRVILSTLRGEIIYVMIESIDLANTMKAFFMHAWEDAKRKAK